MATRKPSPSSNKKDSKMKLFGFLGAGVVAGFVLGAVAMNVGNTTSANAAVNTADKAAIEAVVRDYIDANGKALAQSIQRAADKEQADKLSAMIGDSVPSKGPVDAPVTIVEFSDFQCPFCDRVQGGLNELRAKYGNNIRWVYKNLPLEFHPEAKPAAYASLAAHKQGKFWEYSKELWANQAQLGERTYVDIAQRLKLNINTFNKDRASDAIKQQVENDMADADAIGARGTPHFVINGRGLSGALPASEFSKVIDAELSKARGK